MLKTLPIRAPIDWQINYAVGYNKNHTRTVDERTSRFKIYWAEPGSIFQGWGEGGQASYQKRADDSGSNAARLDDSRIGQTKVQSAGATLYKQKRYEESISAYQQAIQQNPACHKSLSGIGMALKAMRRVDEAIAMQKASIAVEPSYVQAHLNLGVALASQRDIEEATASFRTATLLDPIEPNALVNLGSALHMQEKNL